MDIKTITGPLADVIVTELDAHQPQVLALIEQGEGGVKGAIVRALTQAKPPGLLGVAWPAISGGVERYADQLIAQYGPSVIFAFLEREAKMFAKDLGG